MMENNNWLIKSLSELCDSITYGYTESASIEKIGPKFLRITDIASGILNWDSVPYCKISDSDFEKYRLKAGDIVIARTGATTGANYTFKQNDPENVVYASYLIKYSIDDEIAYPYFIGYVLKSNNWSEFVDAIAGGSAQPGANAKQLGSFEIQLPPLPQQKAIASVLSSLDDKIDLLSQQNQTLEALAETLFRQWFIIEAKEDWREKSLSSIANFLNGLACQKYPPKDSLNKLPVLKIRELTAGITDNSDWATTEIKPEYIVRNGDVIFAWSASLMVKIWNGNDCILNQHLFKVTSNEYPKWFYYFWCKQHLREFIAIAQSHATTMGHIKRGNLDEAIVLIPSQNELEEMTAKIDSILDKIQLNNNQVSSLIKLRDTLLPKLMSGEVRVKM